MSEFAYLDILFFAMVAAFIALRLRGVLGRKTGQERRRGVFGTPQSRKGARSGEGTDNVVALPERGKPVPAPDEGFADVTDPALKAGLSDIRRGDQRFDLPDFLGGARAAFEMIVGAYAAGDKDALKPLLSPTVFANFAGAIDARAAAGRTLETGLSAVRSVEAVGAGVNGRVARVDVRFVSEQSNTVRESSGAVVADESHGAQEVVDLWTFERDQSSRDPNWTLVETRAP